MKHILIHFVESAYPIPDAPWDGPNGFEEIRKDLGIKYTGQHVHRPGKGLDDKIFKLFEVEDITLCQNLSERYPNFITESFFSDKEYS
jgi:hypothetical protein